MACLNPLKFKSLPFEVPVISSAMWIFLLLTAWTLLDSPLPGALHVIQIILHNHFDQPQEILHLWQNLKLFCMRPKKSITCG